MALDPNVNWQAIADYVMFRRVVEERFPSWSWALDHAEIGPLLKKAASDEEWSPEVFTSKLKATDWWTTRTAAQREWDIFEQSAGPEDLDRRLAEARGVMSDSASQLGATLDEATLDALVRESLRNGWNEDEVRGQLLSRSGEFAAGDFTSAQTRVNQLASQYFIDIDDATVSSLSTKLLTNEMNNEGVQQYMRNVAKQRYPVGQITDMIDQGVNLAEYFAPHRSMMAQMLGRNPLDIDFASEFRPVLSIRGEDGAVAPMSLGQTERYVRTLNEFWEGNQGRGERAQLGRGLLRQMGVVG